MGRHFGGYQGTSLYENPGASDESVERHGDVVYSVRAAYPPRRPGSDCGCKRVRLDDGRHSIELCPRHSIEPGIEKFCLKPPRNTRDPGLTP